MLIYMKNLSLYNKYFTNLLIDLCKDVLEIKIDGLIG